MDSISLSDYPEVHPVIPEEKIVEQKDSLTLDEDDQNLVRIARSYVTKSTAYFAEIKLRSRQDKNFNYLFGREANGLDNPLNKRSSYADNVLYEIESTLKPLATSKDPDILVYPAQDNPQNIKSAEDLTTALQYSINTRELKDIKGMVFKHLPVYFIGAVKYRWNPERGKDGDYEFMVVHPQNLVLDSTAKSRDMRHQDFIIEYLDVSVQELIMRFPDKETELLTLLLSQSKITSLTDPNANATKVKIMEVWFKYYEEKDGKWTKISAVFWKYHDLVFAKMKNPNWDWKGETNFFSYDTPVKPEQIMQSMQSGKSLPGFEAKKVFSNYFAEPEFPYIFIGYDDWHTMIYDETSRIEQLVKLQENVDIRGNQIKQMTNRAMGKHIFSTEANLKAEDLEEMDWENMDQAIIIDGDITKAHGFAAAEQPSSAIINDYASTRQIMFQKAHVNALTGVLQSRTATTNQIAREENLTYASDLVDATVNYLSEKMARAIMQMIKLRYTEDHFVRLIGQEGKVLFQRLNRDMIQDGMEVVITASGVDKLQAQNQAMDMAKLQLIDPLTFYEDIGAKNAPERTKRLMTFLTSPDQYMAQYIYGLQNTEQQVGALNGQQPGNGTPGGQLPPGGGQASPQTPQGAAQAQGNQQVMMDIAALQQGQIPQVPRPVTPAYAGAIAQFLQSPEFSQLSPQLQQQVVQFAKAVQAGLQQVETQGTAHLAFGSPKNSQLSAAPEVQNPSPANTAQMPINPPPGIPSASPRSIRHG